MVSTVFISFLALNTLFPILHTSASPFPSPDVAITRPPKRPICPEDLGPRAPRTVGFARDCEIAIASIPRDTRPASPVRNFYLLTEHVDPTMPNVQLPFERESGDCIVQLLMASSMMDVPHERATWMDVWGPARLILQQCIGRKAGGIITNIGENEKLDLAIYSKRSIFAAARRLRNSPRATTNVAEVEFLQLLGLLPGTSRNIRASLNETWVQGEGHAGEGGAIEEVSTA